MADNKTQPTDVPVAQFLAGVEPERRRLEGERLDALMREVTGETGVMWGPSIVGYGTYHYRYASGHEGDWPKVGFSPRKAKLSLYGLKDTPEGAALLPSLGPHTAGAGCVYVSRLDAVDEDVLRRLVAIAYARDS
jgi:Domain of unknown function (DU1801)